MKKDICTREDIVQLVNSFYEKVKADGLLSPMFSKVDWALHLPVMYQFWDNAIFFTGGYLGNPLETHAYMHKRNPLTIQHFTRWLQLFNSTVDELFEGEKASFAKQRAQSISVVMQTKILPV
jgi:hemoglobin